MNLIDLANWSSETEKDHHDQDRLARTSKWIINYLSYGPIHYEMLYNLKKSNTN